MRPWLFLVTMRSMVKQKSGKPPGKVRIIGGRWRGRRIQCLPGAPVRPTGDRIRETLFNWLAPYIRDARCLDLFAGTGALGIEALSRGADNVVFVEKHVSLARQIETTLDELDENRGQVLVSDARAFLTRPPGQFDIVFLDPPFGVIEPINLCTLLANGWLAADALIYIESGSDDAAENYPPGWDVVRDKTTGRVRYRLLRSGDT